LKKDEENTVPDVHFEQLPSTLQHLELQWACALDNFLDFFKLNGSHFSDLTALSIINWNVSKVHLDDAGCITCWPEKLTSLRVRSETPTVSLNIRVSALPAGLTSLSGMIGMTSSHMARIAINSLEEATKPTTKKRSTKVQHGRRVGSNEVKTAMRIALEAIEDSYRRETVASRR